MAHSANQETQTIEWKQSWHDKYLKWICGFANAKGGTLIIGKADNGEIVGVEHHQKLLEDIPNKIRQQLGLVCNVNLIEQNNKYLIEIVTPAYAVPVSYRGHYYYCSGATKTELTGQALNEFLLNASGKTWDDIIEPTATLDDIDPVAIEQFKQDAERAGRLSDLENLNLEQLLSKLRLTENNQLKRAALVLFGKDPGRFYRNLFVKIGRFGTDIVDMRYQEESEGNLILLLKDVMEQLERKFLIKPVSFEGIQRIETLEYPKEALRELLLNALVHRNYTGPMTQIRVHDDRLCIWNSGTLPTELTLEDLTRTHASFPRNPLIAQVCYRAGYIDNWGRGIDKVLQACNQHQLAMPVFEQVSGGMFVTLTKADLAASTTTQITTPNTTPITTQIATQITAPNTTLKILEILAANPKASRKDIANQLGRITEDGVKYHLNQMKKDGLIERVGANRGGHWHIINPE